MKIGIALALPFTRGKGKSAAVNTLLASDSFTDADGTALTSHKLDTGQSWTALAGTFAISGNQVIATGGDASNNAAALIALNTSDNYQITADVIWRSYTGILFRTVDLHNRYFIRMNSSSLGLFKNDGTALGSYSLAPTSGQKYTFKIKVKGQNISVSLDDVERINYTDANTDLAGNKNVGLLVFNDGSSTFDNFRVDAI